MTIFNTPLHTSYALPKAAQGGKDAAYWLPLLGAYSGARLGELCQLRAVDIQNVEGIPVMVLTDDGEGQRIKSEAGKRSVPTHSELLRLGFLDYATAVQAKGVDALCLALTQGQTQRLLRQVVQGLQGAARTARARQANLPLFPPHRTSIDAPCWLQREHTGQSDRT